jgi:peptidyl-prolyl cis-trans isomerase A (cyclophilin A)
MRVLVTSCIAALSLAGALPAVAAPDKEKLMKPDSLTEKAPETFRVKFETTKGDFVLDVTRSWAPRGADRFYNLVKHGYYDECRFFRVLSGFVAQWGINGDPALNRVWRNATIQDDPVVESNRKGYITYAMGGPNTRTTQLFINLADNTRLDGMGFSPFGRVSEGMEVVESLHADYGEGSPRGMGPEQGRIQMEGNKYLVEQFPKLDRIKRATILP